MTCKTIEKVLLGFYAEPHYLLVNSLVNLDWGNVCRVTCKMVIINNLNCKPDMLLGSLKVTGCSIFGMENQYRRVS